MPQYSPPLRDMQFVMHELLNAVDELKMMPRHKDIDADTVRRLGDNGAVFVVVAYDGGTPTATICKRPQWLRAQAQQHAADRNVDASVWGKRQELEIS